MSNEHMSIWDVVKSVPDDVQKPILGGRLKGMTDIKPQWRYQVMTEVFGPIGFGWYYEVKSRWIEQGAGEEKAAFTEIDLFVKVDDQWSKPIVGTGGSSFIANEKNGLYTSDECFKMSLTDALSVAMAKLGVGADIYMGYGSKYSHPIPEQQDKYPEDNRPWINEKQLDAIIKRIQAGEPELKEKAMKEFRMRKEYKAKIQSA